MSDLIGTSLLDITDWKQKGKKLHEAISESVDNVDNFIYVPIPSKVKMTDVQYLGLKNIDVLQPMYSYSQIASVLKRSEKDLLKTKKGYILEVEVVYRATKT
jgi:hypothetical protein